MAGLRKIRDRLHHAGRIGPSRDLAQDRGRSLLAFPLHPDRHRKRADIAVQEIARPSEAIRFLDFMNAPSTK